MIEKIATQIIGSPFGERLANSWLGIILRMTFFSFFYGLELLATHPFSRYGLYILLLLSVIGIAYWIKKYKQNILFSLGISQIFLWISFFIFSKTDLFEGTAFNEWKSWGFPIHIPFMRICPSCGSDVPPLETFPYFLANRCLFFLLSYTIIIFLPKRMLDSKVLQWVLWILCFFSSFVGIAWLGILYD